MGHCGSSISGTQSGSSLSLQPHQTQHLPIGVGWWHGHALHHCHSVWLREGWHESVTAATLPPLTSTGKETPLVATLMAYTWLEDGVEKGPGGKGWGNDKGLIAALLS